MLHFVQTSDGTSRAKNSRNNCNTESSKTICELHTDDNKIKIFQKSKGNSQICKKTSVKNFTPRRQLSKLILVNFFAKVLTEIKNLTNNFIVMREKISSDEITKSINCQTNIKFSENNALKAEFYLQFCN